MSNGHTVNVNRAGDQITIAPTKLRVPYVSGEPQQTLTWRATGCKILNVQILDGNGSVRPPKKVTDQEWQATDINRNRSGSPEETRYSITIDPEIMNDPEPP